MAVRKFLIVNMIVAASLLNPAITSATQNIPAVPPQKRQLRVNKPQTVTNPQLPKRVLSAPNIITTQKMTATGIRSKTVTTSKMMASGIKFVPVTITTDKMMAKGK